MVNSRLENWDINGFNLVNFRFNRRTTKGPPWDRVSRSAEAWAATQSTLICGNAQLPQTRHWVASPDAAVGFLLHAGTMDLAQLGDRRCLTMPGLSVTIAEMIEALARVAGHDVVAHIKRRHDPQIAAIVDGWPRDFIARRAQEAGFKADRDFDSIIRAHIADEAARK